MGVGQHRLGGHCCIIGGQASFGQRNGAGLMWQHGGAKVLVRRLASPRLPRQDIFLLAQYHGAKGNPRWNFLSDLRSSIYDVEGKTHEKPGRVLITGYISKKKKKKFFLINRRFVLVACVRPLAPLSLFSSSFLLSFSFLLFFFFFLSFDYFEIKLHTSDKCVRKSTSFHVTLREFLY